MTLVSGIFEHNKTCYFSLESYALVFWAWKTSTVLFYFIFAKIHASYMAQKSWWDCAHPQTSKSEFWHSIHASEWSCVGTSLSKDIGDSAVVIIHFIKN